MFCSHPSHCLETETQSQNLISFPTVEVCSSPTEATVITLNSCLCIHVWICPALLHVFRYEGWCCKHCNASCHVDFLTMLNVGLQAWPPLTAGFVCPTTTSQLANTTSLLPPARWNFPASCCPYHWQWAALLSNQLSDAGWKQAGPSPGLGEWCWWLCAQHTLMLAPA